MNTNPKYHLFGELLRELRQRANLTQEELAGKVGSDTKTIAQWETGLSSPGFSMLTDLMQILPSLEDILRPLIPLIERYRDMEENQRQELLKMRERELGAQEALKDQLKIIQLKLLEAQNAQQKAQLLAELARGVETEQDLHILIEREMAIIEDRLHYLQSRFEAYQRDLEVTMSEEVEEFLKYISERSQVRIRILEEPTTAQNLLTIISALTELSTKYWLLAKGRFADLIEYTQTHNGQFAEEANIVITRITHNSPVNMDWKFDISAVGVAEAFVTTIDGVTQLPQRLEKAKLENQAKALEIKEAEQKAGQENQMALLEQEKQRLELEQRRLEVLEKQLEVQKKGIEYALELAGKIVDTLRPDVDAAARAMVIQTLLPNIIQLQNGKGLELALPPPPPSAE
jgi:transcriptional regulator with XRE-family HTH domain